MSTHKRPQRAIQSKPKPSPEPKLEDAIVKKNEEAGLESRKVLQANAAIETWQKSKSQTWYEWLTYEDDKYWTKRIERIEKKRQQTAHLRVPLFEHRPHDTVDLFAVK
jgi:hypothetical protein